LIRAKSAGGRVQLNLQLQNAKNGEVLATINETGTELALPELAARLGATLRAKLGLPGINLSQSTELQSSVPSTPEATRLYSGFGEKLRNFDLLGAKDSLIKATVADPNFSLAHAYLAEAWAGLGYDEKAKEEAKTGFELSSHLGREDKTLVEARFREISSEWDKAVDLYRSLWTSVSENPEYAIRSTDVQIRAGKPNDALKTIEQLRKQPISISKDPRLDLKEAEAAASLSDLPKEKQAALLCSRRGESEGIPVSWRPKLSGAPAPPWLFWAKHPEPRRRAINPSRLAKPVGRSASRGPRLQHSGDGRWHARRSQTKS